MRVRVLVMYLLVFSSDESQLTGPDVAGLFCHLLVETCEAPHLSIIIFSKNHRLVTGQANCKSGPSPFYKQILRFTPSAALDLAGLKIL